MKKYFQTFLICLISFFTSSAQEKLPEIIKRVGPSTVVILTYDKEDKPVAQGSGFFLTNDGDVITNRHVLLNSYRAEIKTSQGKTYRIKHLLAEDKEGDIIKVSVDIPLTEVFPLGLSTSLPEVGESIVVIGNPLGLEQTVSSGIVSSIRQISGFGNIIQITAPISHGSSGGPVLNMKGEVIGIATFQISEGQNLNFAIPGERIRKLISKKGKTIAEWGTDEKKGETTLIETPYLTGFNLILVGDYEKALPYFERAVANDPKFAKAYYYIGYCKYNIGLYNESILVFKKAILLNPNYAAPLSGLGLVYMILSRYTEAIEAYKKAIRIEPDDAFTHHSLGFAYESLERYAEAIEEYKLAIHIDPDDIIWSHVGLGDVYSKLNQYTDAIEEYKLAIRLNANNKDAYFGLAGVYVYTDRYAEAIEAYKQMIRIKPDDADAHYFLGVTYVFAGEKGSALEEYKILKDLDKKLAEKLFNKIYK